MKKSFVFLLTVSIVFSFSILSAQPFKHKPMQKPNGIFQQLKLNDSQLKKFNELKFDNQEKMIDLKAKIQKERLSLKKMITNGNINKSAALNIVDKISSLRSKMAKQKISLWFDVYNFLDNTQKKVWINNFDKMSRMHHGMMKGRKPMKHNCFGRMR